MTHIKNKDWLGNKVSTFKNIGASNHTDKERAEYDYYATEPKAAELLLEVEPELSYIWECACGEGHLADVFDSHCRLEQATDIVDRGYRLQEGTLDFLKYEGTWVGDIVTNPPYKYAKEFVEKALEVIEEGNKVCMFLKIQFLEGKARKKFFNKYPPKTIYVSSSRLNCAMNGDFKTYKVNSAVAYAWYVWEKGYKGKPTIEWIN